MSSEPVTRLKSKQPVPYELTAIHRDTHDTKTFRCHHVLSEPPAGADTVIFLCGPPSMVDAIETTLKAIGHAEQAIILP